MLSLQRAGVQSLVGELRSQKQFGAAKKKSNIADITIHNREYVS